MPLNKIKKSLQEQHTLTIERPAHRAAIALAKTEYDAVCAAVTLEGTGRGARREAARKTCTVARVARDDAMTVRKEKN